VVKIDLRIDLFTYLFIFWTVPKSYKSIGEGGFKDVDNYTKWTYLLFGHPV